MKKGTKAFRPFKFASVTIYYTLTVLGLVVLTKLYSLSTLAGITNLSDPLVFALFIMMIGFVVSFFYELINVILNLITFLIYKKHTGALCTLESSETSVISIIACITVGCALAHHVQNYPEMEIAVKMIFSLPISKIAFLNTNPMTLISEVTKLFTQTFTTWVFMVYIAIELIVLLCFESIAMYINIVLIIFGILLALHSKPKRKMNR